MKTCKKKGEAEMHWTVGQLIGLLQHPLVSDYIRNISQNDFKLF